MRAITHPASFLCTTNQTAVPLTWVPQRARCAICGHTNAHARVGQKAPASTGSIKWFGAESQSSPARPGCLQPRAGREGRDEGTEHPNNRSSRQQMKVGAGLHFVQCPDNKCVCMCVCVRVCMCTQRLTRTWCTDASVATAITNTELTAPRHTLSNLS